MWARDAARMVETAITWVRIGAFAWRRLEKVEGTFTFEWLDRAIAVLADAGLKVVMCTPTTTPPRWMIEKHPDMLAVDANGNPRKFGSRRHYCFSHHGYIQDCERITRVLADHYGAGPRIHAWQVDNQYGCHDTIISYSDVARAAFQEWLTDRYGDVEALNTAWGNVFWSMEYDRFDQIDLPNLTVTEPNPAHVMAFRRFSSDQVVKFNRVQVNVLRAATDVPLIHNYRGRILDFDHFEVGEDLDIASWDSYPTLMRNLRDNDALAVLGPRTATVTDELSIPPQPQPGIAGLDVKIELSESFPPSHIRSVEGGGSVVHWMEKLSGSSPVLLKTEGGATVLTGDDQMWYLGSWPDETLWDRLVGMAATQAGLHTTALPNGLRLRAAGAVQFAFNYSAHSVSWNDQLFDACSVTAWDRQDRILT